MKGFLVYDTRKSDFEKRNCMLVETADGLRVLRHGKLVKDLPDPVLDPYVILMRSHIKYVGGSGIVVGSIVRSVPMHPGGRSINGTVKFLEGRFVVDTGDECYDLWNEEYLWTFEGLDRAYIEGDLRRSAYEGRNRKAFKAKLSSYKVGRGVYGYKLNDMVLFRKGGNSLF